MTEWKVVVAQWQAKNICQASSEQVRQHQHPDFKIDKGVKDADIRKTSFCLICTLPGLGLNSNISTTNTKQIPIGIIKESQNATKPIDSLQIHHSWWKIMIILLKSIKVISSYGAGDHASLKTMLQNILKIISLLLMHLTQ